MVGLGFVYFDCWPPKICLALAIFDFYYGVMNFFFYYGFAGGITTIGAFTDAFCSGFIGYSSFFALKLLLKMYSLLETNGKDCCGDFCSYGVKRISFSMLYFALIFLYYLAPFILAFWTNPSKKLMSSSKLTWFDFLRAALYLASFLDSLLNKKVHRLRW